MALSWIRAFFYFDYPGSHQLLENQLSLFSESPTLHFLVGYILRKEGKIKESNESFFKALDLASSVCNRLSWPFCLFPSASLSLSLSLPLSLNLFGALSLSLEPSLFQTISLYVSLSLFH